MRIVLRSRAGAQGIRFVSRLLVLWVASATAIDRAVANQAQGHVTCRGYFAAPEAATPGTRFTLTFDDAVEIANFGLGRHAMARDYLAGDEAFLKRHLERAGRSIVEFLDPRGVLLPPADRSHFESLIRDGNSQLFDEIWLMHPGEDGPVTRLMAVARESLAQFRLALRDPTRLLARGRALPVSSVSTPLEALAAWLSIRTQEQRALGFSENESVQFAVRQLRAELEVREAYAVAGARPTLLLMAVFRGLDPHSFYLPPDAAERSVTERRGTYRGIGVRFIDTPRGALITGVAAESPAHRAGIHVGEAIVGVGRARFTVDQFDAMASALSTDQDGPALTLHLRSDGREREVTVIREQVAARAHVEGGLLKGLDGRSYAVIRILDFTDGVADQAHALARELAPQAAGVLIDLRGNAGGSLHEATAVAVDFMLTSLQPVTRFTAVRSTTFVSPPDHQPVYAGPLVILVDSQSASGAEAVAGALQALGRAVVVGQRTYGKGTGQAVLSGAQLPGPGMLRVSEGYFYLPDGRSPQRTGIQPDVELPERPGAVMDREAGLPGALPESRIAPLLEFMPPAMWDRIVLEQRLVNRFGLTGPAAARGAGSGDPERTMAIGVLEELAGLVHR